MSWQKSLTNLFHTWRAEASNPTRHPLLTHPQDIHTTLRYETTLPWGAVQPDISLLGIKGLGLMEQQATGYMHNSIYGLSGTLWDAKAFLLLLLFPACFLWDNSMIKEAHFSQVFVRKEKNEMKKTTKKTNLGSWLFLFWSSELRRKEEDNICGFNSCLSVVVSVYLDKYSLLWPLTLLHIGVLYAFRWSFLILFLVALDSWDFFMCIWFGTFVCHLSCFLVHRFCFSSVQSMLVKGRVFLYRKQTGRGPFLIQIC